MKSNKVSFVNRSGIILSAYLDLPDYDSPTFFGILSHCFTCNKQYKVIVNISKALTRKGLGILRFDFTGLGESTGDFKDTNFTTTINDIIDSAKYLEANFKGPSFLVGHSLGGLSAMKASYSIRSVNAISTIGSPSSLNGLYNRLSANIESWDENGEAMISIVGRPFKINKKFLEDIKTHNIDSDIKSLKSPVLVFHPVKDDIVDISQSLDIFNMAPYPKGIITLDNSNHLITNNEDGLYIGNILGEWLKRYL